eukprot:TRINITY_DN46763_c0_g1_i1.p1 TRINITY_DN46763_c0_g1~~TRINITY_DN46763_c0_g1_i1.p1  ORF type:complete len:1275 (+),score=364.64 TRINITY_DN46763_c0_g1_i1:61-3885(+)
MTEDTPGIDTPHDYHLAVPEVPQTVSSQGPEARQPLEDSDERLTVAAEERNGALCASERTVSGGIGSSFIASMHFHRNRPPHNVEPLVDPELNGAAHRKSLGSTSAAKMRRRAASAPDFRMSLPGAPTWEPGEAEWGRPTSTNVNGERQRLLAHRSGTFSRRGSVVSDAWEEDFYEEAAEDHFFKPGRDFESIRTAHRFTDAERARMQRYDAIDFWIPSTKMLKTLFASSPFYKRSHKWLVYGAVGGVVGIIAFVLLNTLNALHEWRISLLEHALEGKHGSSRWIGFLPWYGTGLGFVLVSVMLCCIWTPAAGSGVPDVMAYLNGVMFRRVFNIRTLVMKVLSCALAVSGGMPVGPEGPMIHIGALVGAGISTGRSRSLKCAGPCCAKWRSDPRDHRDFITAGAAAGVACAFSAPVGGLLFVIEEITSFYSTKAMWMAFFCCLVAIVTYNSVATNVEGWQLRESAGGECTAWARWEPGNTILFKANVQKDVNLMSIIPTVVTGLICGVLASVFTFTNLKIVRWRSRYVNKNNFRRIVEPCALFTIFALLCMATVLAMDCKSKPKDWDLNYGNNVGKLKWFDAVCDNQEEEYHPLGTLIFASPDDSVRLLFRRDPSVGWDNGTKNSGRRQASLIGARLFPYSTLALWLLLYGIFSCWAAGTHIASGIVIPMLTIGSIIGRLVGLAMVDIMESLFKDTCGGVDEWVDPGLFALVGSAAFFGGVSRLTFSLCVIMLELSSDLSSLAPIMIGVMIAKTVADNFTHPLYHALLEVRCVPFLDYDCNLPYLDVFAAAHLMSKVTHRTMFTVRGETVKKVRTVLETTDHNGFPVVGTRIKPGRFKGTVTRAQLQLLMRFLDERRLQEVLDGKDPWEAARNAANSLSVMTQDQFIAMSERMFWERDDLEEAPDWPDGDPILLQQVDLTNVVNTSAFTVPKNFCVSATYTLFRSMGLRHLVVVNAANQVAGIITRKDLITQNIEEHTVARVCLSCRQDMMADKEVDFLEEVTGATGLGRSQTTLLVTKSPESALWREYRRTIRPSMRLVCVNHEIVCTLRDLRRAVRRAPNKFDVEFLPHGTDGVSRQHAAETVQHAVNEPVNPRRTSQSRTSSHLRLTQEDIPGEPQDDTDVDDDDDDDETASDSESDEPEPMDLGELPSVVASSPSTATVWETRRLTASGEDSMLQPPKGILRTPGQTPAPISPRRPSGPSPMEDQLRCEGTPPQSSFHLRPPPAPTRAGSLRPAGPTRLLVERRDRAGSADHRVHFGGSESEARPTPRSE